MYIVSKFHDYYDTAATYGIDKTVVYKRMREEIALPRTRYGVSTGEDYIGSADEHGPYPRVIVSEFLIGFCGKVYQGIRLEQGHWVACAYDANQFFLEAERFGLNVDLKAKKTTWSRLKAWRGGINAGYAKDYFAKDFTKVLESKFTEHHTPIFTVTMRGHKQMLTINDTLKDFKFQKIADPHTAFQNIYMYLSGVLGQPKDIPSKQTDKEKAASHGHDSKYSFKKPPGGGRWR